jgi:hypothetical protein
MAVHHASVDAVVRRLALLLPAAILAALASLAPVAQVVPACAAAGSHHAALVVEHGDGSVVSRCVAFSTAAISGEELLNRSGVPWSSQTFGGFGAAVCALDGEPAHYVDCPGKDRYWAVFSARGGASWQLANVGISALTLHDGDALGVRYVPASGSAAAPVSAAGVCAAAAAPTPRRSVTASTAASTAASSAASPAAGSPKAGVTPTIAPAGATAAAAASGAPLVAAVATFAPRPPSQAPIPAPPGGLDPGLLLAAGVGGGLAGLAILKLVAGRRTGQ